jgi:hypothetical protein
MIKFRKKCILRVQLKLTILHNLIFPKNSLIEAEAQKKKFDLFNLMKYLTKFLSPSFAYMNF